MDMRERRLAAKAPTYSSMSIRDPPAESAKRFDEVAAAAKQRQAGGRLLDLGSSWLRRKKKKREKIKRERGRK